ncbi:unnamed protein product [marine sediment metagenome]|uniref:Uncharacterized protein n=1 Tax=marine sediment metagenome TaxID=412755 RepID=X0SL08_9ZZZZ
MNGSGVSSGGIETASLYNTSLTLVTSISYNLLEADENASISTVPVAGGVSYYIKISRRIRYDHYNGAPYRLGFIPIGTAIVAP